MSKKKVPAVRFNANTDEFTEMIDRLVESDPEYKKAQAEYAQSLITREKLAIDAAVNYREWTACNAVYKKAFHDGMSFILRAISGEEVIDL